MTKRLSKYLPLALLLLPNMASASPEKLAEARAATREWVEVEKASSHERLAWEERKARLQDLLAVGDKRLEQLEAALAETESSASGAAEERSELLEEEARLEKQRERVRQFLADMEPALRELRRRLPAPLQEELAELFRKMPSNPGETDLSLGERMRTIADVLTGIREFDGRITVSESIEIVPASGEEGAVQTLWIGLGQAYYLGPDDAGYGRHGADGWRWHSQPELAADIREGIALAEGAAAPRWLELPIYLDREGTR